MRRGVEAIEYDNDGLVTGVKCSNGQVAFVAAFCFSGRSMQKLECETLQIGSSVDWIISVFVYAASDLSTSGQHRTLLAFGTSAAETNHRGLWVFCVHHS